MSRRNSAARSRTPQTHDNSSTLRIIGGEWRSRKLPFPTLEGLRPTPDRVRETLFNWLQTSTPGAACLDLFCGSGALGFEALSRGATSVTFVDQAPEVAYQIRQNLQQLKAQNAEVTCSNVLDWLESKVADQEARYDLVFLDPPFNRDLIRPVVTLLESRGLLNNQSLIYIESESHWVPDGIPANWILHREKRAGQVCYRLYRRNETLTAEDDLIFSPEEGSPLSS
ncbi:MAG: 16S rRNA (guanine(966)-N(2))-methyltransferase RsmD [Nitrincola lacisaponensis]|uniref:Ribosomal RNA small subunit methyltransferase D n=1 Tax=Nitrincola lacisaponensis TaxID=267850 RepID=A0A063XZI9_9GAMM|nr:16S rRNA (guanine(966)-N(2))-methyltransferase RsmD [Nitrincola lacisaponensis]KDE38884.1 Ribosomal RNA small subunit methyltransferase D [Nitrincola lacisaponensis]